MNKTLTAFLALSFPACALAQTWSSTRISPKGAEFFEGNSSSDIMFGNWAAQTRTQQIDANLIGQAAFPLVGALGWRRNGSSAAGAAKTTDLTILMAHADFATITATFASNYKTPPQTVFAKKPVSLPDWNANSGSSPSPFDAVVPFDTPFVYNRVDALLYDVLNENNPLGAYGQDWISSMTHTYGDYPVDLGGACTTANGKFVQRCALRADAATLQMGFSAKGATAGAAVTALVGATDLNLGLPGLLCGRLHTDALLALPAGSADASGDLPLAYPVSLAWNSALAGVALYSQLVAPDASFPGVPIAMSNGLQVFVPATNATGTAPINTKRIYHTSSVTAVTGTLATSAVPTFYAF